jgi:mRNA-degrading endonuclease HigB of HigAB toxin-antitoxin module
VVLKLGRFGQQIRNTRKVFKCGAGEGWRSVGPIMFEIKKCYLESMSREYPTLNKKTEG